MKAIILTKYSYTETVCSDCRLPLYNHYDGDKIDYLLHTENKCPHSGKRFKLPTIELEEAVEK